MAGSFNDFLELELLDHVFAAATYTPPATHHVALYTAAPTDAGGGTEVPSSFAYARVAVTANATNWPAAAAGAIANGTAVTFATASGGSWGTIVAMAILDAASAGNFLCWADLAVSKSVDDGDTAEFAIGDIDITLD